MSYSSSQYVGIVLLAVAFGLGSFRSISTVSSGLIHMYPALVMQRVGSLMETHPVASATSPQRTASASPTVDPGSETLDVAGAAERLKVSGKMVRRLGKADIIPFARIGTRLRFHRQRLI